jgi:hypothetical protein
MRTLHQAAERDPSFFFIENTFYNDFRSSSHDTSKLILDWAKKTNPQLPAGILPSQFRFSVCLSFVHSFFSLLFSVSVCLGESIFFFVLSCLNCFTAWLTIYPCVSITVCVFIWLWTFFFSLSLSSSAHLLVCLKLSLYNYLVLLGFHLWNIESQCSANREICHSLWTLTIIINSSQEV